MKRPRWWPGNKLAELPDEWLTEPADDWLEQLAAVAHHEIEDQAPA